jgi:GT2 family glycosyltransferase
MMNGLVDKNRRMVKLSVVILNWNGRQMLEQFLPSVCRHSSVEGVEIVVADNASSDDSIAFLNANYPEIRQIVLNENYGYAEGYNRALEQLDSEYFVLLNSDVEVTEGWLEPVVGYLDEHPDVAACQPKIRAYTNREYFEHAGACGGFIDMFGYPFCRGRILNVIEKDTGQYDTVTDLFWATGAAFFVRATEYRKNGGLDGDFFAHMEEIDFCWRLRSRGKRIVCIPQSVVYHLGGGTLNVENPRKTFLNFRNNLLMIYKNEHPERKGKVLFVRFLLDYAAAFMFLFKGDFGNCKAVFSARKAFQKMKPLYSDIRKKNIELSVNKNIKEVFPQSIILNFYIRGIKKFQEWR